MPYHDVFRHLSAVAAVRRDRGRAGSRDGGIEGGRFSLCVC